MTVGNQRKLREVVRFRKKAQIAGENEKDTNRDETQEERRWLSIEEKVGPTYNSFQLS